MISSEISLFSHRFVIDLNSVSDNSTKCLSVGLGEKLVPWPVDVQKWSFKQLSRFYKKVNVICKSYALGVVYNHSEDRVHSVLCGKWHCDRCRPMLKKQLIPQLSKAMMDLDLKYHIVITTEGNEKYRDDHTYLQSYPDMMVAWNKIRKIFDYDAKKKGLSLSYVCFPRAQKNGYCHLHVLTNVHPGIRRLQNICKKYPNTGFVKIKDSEDTLSYLLKDFKKDHEWHIPLGRRHFTCSRDVNLSVHDTAPNPDHELHIMIVPGVSVVDQVFDQLENWSVTRDVFGTSQDVTMACSVPFSFVLGIFYQMVHKMPTRAPNGLLKGGVYVNGEFVRPVKRGVSRWPV